MPTNYELYYGFTRFAIELNELDPVLKDLLPPTDARFRPDQRWAEQWCLKWTPGHGMVLAEVISTFITILCLFTESFIPLFTQQELSLLTLEKEYSEYDHNRRLTQQKCPTKDNIDVF